MKKLMAIGLLTIGLVSTTQQEAAAWSKWNFNIGLNMSYEGGNNRWLWGFVNSGQVPGYPSDLTGGCHYGPQAYSSYPTLPAPCYASAAPAFNVHALAPQHHAVAKTQTANWYGNQSYQPAHYQYQAPSYYPANPHYYPQPGHSQAPSYWYGY